MWRGFMPKCQTHQGKSFTQDKFAFLLCVLIVSQSLSNLSKSVKQVFAMKIVTDKTPKVDIASILTKSEMQAIDAYIHHYPQARAAVLDALKFVQKRNGWVDDAQVVAIANMLNIAIADVEGVATFFNRIYRQPVGRHVILLCDSIACYLTGFEEVAHALKMALSIEYGQTTADNRFTLLPICCLGNCDKGPSLLIDEDTYGPVGPNDIAMILEQYP